MPRPDTSSVSEEDVEALFGTETDGDVSDDSETVEDDSGEETEEAEQVEGEEPAEETEEGEESDDEEPEEESEVASEPKSLDWSKMPPAHRKAHEALMAEAQKWKKDYGKLQSDFTKRGQAQRTEERDLSNLREKASHADQWNALLGQNPELHKLIQREVARIRDPMAQEIPEYLKSDPAFQYMQKTYDPMIRKLQSELAEARQVAGKVNQWESREKQAESQKTLDGLLDDARNRIKSGLGRDATEEEMTEVLKFMVENEYYRSGKLAASEVFGDRFEKAKQARQASTMRQKAGKFPARNKSVNANRVSRSSQDATTPDEAIARALADQGYGTN
jgi:hypothetical protein